MEYSYGINVANRYVLLVDEPEDIPNILKEEPDKDKEAKKTKSKKNLISEKENKGDANQKGPKKQPSTDNKKSNNQRAQKGHVKFAAEVYEEKPPYQRSTANNEASEQRDSGDDSQTEGSGNFSYRGGSRGRGGRGTRGRGRGFGRVFSRGGRGGGGGFRRYGADQQGDNQAGDFYNQEKQPQVSEAWDDAEENPKPAAPEEPLDWASDVPEGFAEQPQKQEEEQPAAQTQDDPTATEENPEDSDAGRALLTLDEYKAMKGNREKPKYNLRRAGEGEDLSQWQTMHVLKNKLADVPSEEEEEKYDPADYPQRVGRQKHILDINIQFKNAPRRGRGRARGGRWAGSRGRGDGNRFDNSEGEPQDQESSYERPGSFSQHAKQHTVTICNESEFPSLA